VAKKPVKKMRMRVNLPEGLAVVSDQPSPVFADEFEKWKTEAGKPLPDGSGAKTVLEWINRMGKVGRKKGKVAEGTVSNFEPKVTTIPQYIALAEAVGKEKNLSEAQFNAINDLKKYIDDNDSKDSKINPANIEFNTITRYREVDGEGRAIAFGKIYGDYRTRRYADFRNKYRDGNVPIVPTTWYSEIQGEGKPPVWQAIWGRKDANDFFKSESLREICEGFDGAVEELTFQTNRNSPLQVGGNGTAEFLMNNVPGFRAVVKEMVNNLDEFRLPNGNFRAKRAMTRQRKIPIPYKLNDQQSAAILSHINAKVKIDLQNIFLNVNWRQMEHAAKMLPEFKSKYGKQSVEEKTDVSEDGVKKSQEKSPVSLNWKEMVKVRT